LKNYLPGPMQNNCMCHWEPLCCYGGLEWFSLCAL